MKIRYDSRGCGTGKTTTGIYKKIEQNQLAGIPTLLVVPSIRLQDEYFKAPALAYNILVINSTHQDVENTVIRTMAAMKRSESLICITHATFVKLPTGSITQHYSLILDEALDNVISRLELNTIQNNKWNPNLNIPAIFSLPDTANKIYSECVRSTPELLKADTDWYPLTQSVTNLDFMFRDSQVFKQLADTNYIKYVTLAGWHTLIGADPGKATLICSLNPDVFRNWQDVYIASAKFDNTKQYHWMRSAGFQLEQIPGTDFIPHKGNIHFWLIEAQDGFTWSNYKRKKYPELLHRYHLAVLDQIGTEPVMTLRNSKETRRLCQIKPDLKPDQQQEYQLKHNVHGQNDLQKYRNVSLESTINPSPDEVSFLKQTWLCHLTDSRIKFTIKHMYLAHIFYQVIMRTELRSQTYSGAQINVFCMDPDAAVCLMDYFDIPPRHYDTYIHDLGIDITTPDARRAKLTESERAERRKQQSKLRVQRYRANQKTDLFDVFMNICRENQKTNKM